MEEEASPSPGLGVGVRLAKNCQTFGSFGVNRLEDRPGGLLADMERVVVYLFKID